MTIVDTTVWIDYLAGAVNPETTWLDREVGRRPIGLTDLILCELLQGIRDDTSFRKVQAEMAKFNLFQSGGQALAVASAQNYRRLRSRGLTVRKTIDCMIATFCLREQHTLLHRDRDYDGFAQYLDLKVIKVE